MATSNFQTQKPFPFLQSITLTFFLLLLNPVNSIETTCFSFEPFREEEKNLNIQGSAALSPPMLRLTEVGDSGEPLPNTVGQVNYVAPIPIWDKEEDTLLDFVTKFHFLINASTDKTKADGFAFYLAPKPSHNPPASGGLFGLFEEPSSNKSNHVVAVEFDTYRNEWDPCICEYAHIGFNLHSVKSATNGTWHFRNGEEARAVISYRASKKLLKVVLYYVSGPYSQEFETTVDLREYLPQWIYVGLSATTGDYAETHDILSWDFKSMLPGTSDEEFLKHTSPSKKRLRGSM